MCITRNVGCYLIKGSFGFALLWGLTAEVLPAARDDLLAKEQVQDSTLVEGFPIPFESLINIDEEDQKALHDAEEQAVAACMEARGFQYTPTAFDSKGQRLQSPTNLDVEAAQAHGYGIADGFMYGEQMILGNDIASDIDAKYLSPEEQQAWGQALLGIPPESEEAVDSTNSIANSDGSIIILDPESCASKGRSAIYGDDLHWQQLQDTVAYLQEQVIDSEMNDPAYQDAVARWRQCMNENGYDYEQPLAAGEILREEVLHGEIDRALLRSTEREVATADIQCVLDSGMDSVAATLMTEYERQIGDTNQEILREFTELQNKAIAQAHIMIDPGNQ